MTLPIEILPWLNSWIDERERTTTCRFCDGDRTLAALILRDFAAALDAGPIPLPAIAKEESEVSEQRTEFSDIVEYLRNGVETRRDGRKISTWAAEVIEHDRARFIEKVEQLRQARATIAERDVEIERLVAGYQISSAAYADDAKGLYAQNKQLKARIDELEARETDVICNPRKIVLGEAVNGCDRNGYYFYRHKIDPGGWRAGWCLEGQSFADEFATFGPFEIVEPAKTIEPVQRGGWHVAIEGGSQFRFRARRESDDLTVTSGLHDAREAAVQAWNDLRII